MQWMKIQIKYSRGSPPDIHGQIMEAHSQGFKILISALGYPSELGQGGAGYVSDFAHWLGRVAAWGADAIEVWNEPNLDREWPQGQISGAAYADMLRQAYQSIKRANPNVMVISAAPAPTGHHAEPDRVMPDNKWLREVAAAGGADYMDCVGVHTTTRASCRQVKAAATPRGDDYYTRYFNQMIIGYLSIIRDKPLCLYRNGLCHAAGLCSLAGRLRLGREYDCPAASGMAGAGGHHRLQQRIGATLDRLEYRLHPLRQRPAGRLRHHPPGWLLSSLPYAGGGALTARE